MKIGDKMKILDIILLIGCVLNIVKLCFVSASKFNEICGWTTVIIVVIRGMLF